MSEQIQKPKTLSYVIHIYDSEGHVLYADLDKHREWFQTQLDIASKESLQQAHERIFQLSNLLNVLTDDNKFVSERLAKLILERLPKDKSIKHWDVTKLHPALEVNTHATFAALRMLATEGKVTEKRNWVRLVPAKEAKA